MKTNKIRIKCSDCNKYRFIDKANKKAAEKRSCKSCSQKKVQTKRFPPSRKGLHSGLGYIGSDGYRMISIGIRTYKREHRLVMEAKLGRKLKPTEKVHHINFDRLDNRIENLFLCSSESVHRLSHSSLKSVIKNLINAGVLDFDNVSGTYHMAQVKSCELLETPSGQSAAKPLRNKGKVQRLRHGVQTGR